MRDYGKVAPQFWTGTTGKSLRGEVDAQLVALYLITSPHSNMIGVYTLPILYIAHDTGLTIEGAWKGLRRCIKAQLCTYDEASETVFVHEMAAHQIGCDLKGGDKRLIGVRKQFDALRDSVVKSAFHARYGACYGLAKQGKTQRGIDAPSRPLPSQEQEQEQEEDQERLSSAAPHDPPTDLAAKRQERAERLSQITNDAIAAYNSILAKPTGLLASVSLKVGREKRRDQVARCLRVVRQICDENYGSTIVTPEFWKDYFTECLADSFLNGTGPYSGVHINWRPDFELLTREAQVLKVYDRAASEGAA